MKHLISKISQKNNIDICSHKKIKGKNNLLILFTKEDEKYVLKKINNNNIFQKLNLQNEICIYQKLHEDTRRNFKLFDIIDYEWNKYILFDFLNGQFHYKNIDIDKFELIELIFSFQSAPNRIDFNKSNQSFFTSIIKYVKYSPVVKSFRRLLDEDIRENLDLKELIKLLFFLIRSFLFGIKFKIDAGNYFMVHGDSQNIAIDNNENFYLYDFESSFKTQNDLFLLIDVVHLAIDDSKENFSLDFELIKHLVKKLKGSQFISISNKGLLITLKFALIERILHLLSSKKTSKTQKSNYSDFLRNILLEDIEYQKWYDLNFGNIEV